MRAEIVSAGQAWARPSCNSMRISICGMESMWASRNAAISDARPATDIVSGSRCAQDSVQGLEADRLDEMLVESRLTRPALVLALPPAADGHELHRPTPFLRTHALGDLVARELRHAQV